MRNEKSTFVKATVGAVEPSRIKSNYFMKGIKLIESFIRSNNM